MSKGCPGGRHQVDPAVTAETIMDAIIEYRRDADDADDWWHSVAAEGYPLGVDVNIYFDPYDGIATREAHVYPNIADGDGGLTTDTSRLLAIIPERNWPPPIQQM